jgi:sialic acid synthase SpsE
VSREDEIDAALKTILDAGGRRVVLLHCVPRFPPDDAEINLLAMKTMEKRFGTPAGISDHSAGFTAALGAAALGASVVEKYITLDKNIEGPDHSFAMEPDDFAEMVAEIRRLETMMGDGAMRSADKEQPEQTRLKRSLVAARTLKKGSKLKAEDILCVRPGGGIPPEDLPEVIGKKSARKIEQDAMFTEEDFV